MRITAGTGSATLARRASWTTSKPLGAYGDRALLAGIAQGDTQALGELYDRFGPVAFGLALRVLRDRELAEDAVQEAFLSVWRSAPRFDSRRGTARTWVLTLVHRRAVDLVQRTQRHHGHANEEVTERLAPSAAEAADLDRERQAVQMALAALPAKQRTVLELAYYGGYTQKEIAVRLDLPVGTVKSQTFDGLKRLEQRLGVAGRRSA